MTEQNPYTFIDNPTESGVAVCNTDILNEDIMYLKWLNEHNVARHIGEIITSTIPLTDAGLHLLDGSLLSYGSYKDFIDYMAGLYNDGNYSFLFATEANWQQSITDYGVCGKFVYNSSNNTIRLPKITGFVEGASGTSSLGNLTEAGLPNVTGSFNGIVDNAASGAFSIQSQGASQISRSGAASYIVNFNATNSSSIYGNSSTVQPQSVKVLYYIVIATTTKTDIEVDIDEIATDLNGKMDRDGLNSVNSVKFADGQWVVQETELSTVKAVGTYNINLANVLPNDNYEYECIFKYLIEREDSSNSNSYYNSGVTVNNVNVEFVTDCVQGGTSSSDSVREGGEFIMPIGTNRSMFIIISLTNLYSHYTKLVAYRRIGTNQ